MIAVAAIPIALATAAWWGWRWFEWSRLYHPKSALTTTPAAAGREFEDVEFVAEDAVRLHGWWIPAVPARGTVLYCHGNGDNIGDLIPVASILLEMGVNVFLFDYRGYGRSRGWPTERGTYRDARAAYECVRARHDDSDAPPVVALGRSLGGAVAAQLALDRPLRAVILKSTFASTAAMGRRLYPRLPAERLCRFRYDTLSKIGRITIPTLLAHSPNDGLIPLEQARALFARSAGRPKRFVKLEGLHNEAGLERSPDYRAAVRKFLEEALPRDGEPA